MPKSILDQINAAIRNSEDTSERAMLLVLLQLYNLWKENADELAKMNSSLETIARAHDGIDPDDHLDHHGWVHHAKSSEERAGKFKRDVLVGTVKDLAGKAVWGIAIFLLAKLFGF